MIGCENFVTKAQGNLPLLPILILAILKNITRTNKNIKGIEIQS